MAGPGLLGLGSRLSPGARRGRAAPSPLSVRAGWGVWVTQARGRGDPGHQQEGKAAGARGSGEQQRAAARAWGIALRPGEEQGLQMIYLGNFRINCCWDPSP